MDILTFVLLSGPLLNHLLHFLVCYFFDHRWEWNMLTFLSDDRMLFHHICLRSNFQLWLVLRVMQRWKVSDAYECVYLYTEAAPSIYINIIGQCQCQTDHFMSNCHQLHLNVGITIPINLNDLSLVCKVTCWESDQSQSA